LHYWEVVKNVDAALSAILYAVMSAYNGSVLQFKYYQSLHTGYTLNLQLFAFFNIDQYTLCLTFVE